MRVEREGLDHVGFTVSDLERAIEFYRLLRPVEIPVGPYRGGKAAYLRDPDGISVELLQPPPGGPRF